MKQKFLAATITTLLLVSGQAQADDYFKEWCDTFTAQGLISSVASRIFGNISSLSDLEYKKRSEWVNSAYKLSEQRFKKITGHEFIGYADKQAGDWVMRCQIKDQIL